MALTGGLGIASSKRIALKAGVTGARGIVIVDGTRCVDTAHTRTGVDTLVVDTGQLGWALLVDCAFRLAFHVGVALQAGQAGAGRGSVTVVADGVDAARRRTTGVNNLRCRSGGYKFYFCIGQYQYFLNILNDKFYHLMLQYIYFKKY